MLNVERANPLICPLPPQDDGSHIPVWNRDVRNKA
jgi:hypothetical protein